jgi:hypothetical protein
MLGRLTVSLIKTNGTTSGPAAIGERAKDAAAQAIPVGKRVGTTAVQGVRQGVQGAKEWAGPRLEDAVHGAKEWAAPRLEDAVQGAREWAAPRLEDAADAVDITVAPKVSSALRSTAAQVRPSGTKRNGIRRLLDWRLLLGVGVAMAAAGAGAAITMRRRYASATAEAATEASEDERGTQAGDSAPDAVAGSEVNGRVTTPGT